MPRQQRTSRSVNPSQTTPVRTAAPAAQHIAHTHTEAAYVEQHVSFSPLPDPRVLEAYDRLVPGTADLVIKQWVKQSDHRMALENYTLHWNNWRSWGGLIVSAAVSIFAIWLAYNVIKSGHEAAGIASVVAAIGIPGGAFVYATYSRRAERKDRARLMTGSDN